MNYFIDTEFHEHKQKGIDTIELISIGIVCENEREYYDVCNDFDVKAAWNNDWLRVNVLNPIFNEFILKEKAKSYRLNQLNIASKDVNDKFTLKRFRKLLSVYGKSKSDISYNIKRFVYSNHGDFEVVYDDSKVDNIEFYAYYADYDWVVFCWLFGRMIDLPNGFPMYCRDLKQIMDDNKLDSKWKSSNCQDPVGVHNALIDAKWNLSLFNNINNI